MKPRMLQIDKEINQDDVVEIVDHLLCTGVDYLHLISYIHIELFRELAIKADKEPVLVESCLRSASAPIAHKPIQVDENFIERHEPPIWKHRQRDIHTQHCSGTKGGALYMVYPSFFQPGATINFYEWKCF